MKNKLCVLSVILLLACTIGCSNSINSASSSETKESISLDNSSSEEKVTSSSENSTSESIIVTSKNIDPSLRKITLLSNYSGEEVSILHPEIQKYCDAMYEAEKKEGLTEAKKYMMRKNPCGNVTPKDYQGTKGVNDDRDNFEDVVLKYDVSTIDATSFKVYYGTKEDLSDAKVIVTSDSSVNLTNLYCDTTYYWKVEGGDISSEIGSFHTKGSFRNISCGTAYNFRDFGGKMTSSGRRIKQGLVFRGGELTPVEYGNDKRYPGVTYHFKTLDDTALRVLHDDMNIRLDLDLRGEKECNGQKESWLNGYDVSNLNKNSPNYVVLQREPASSYVNLWNSSDKAMLKRIFMAFGNATEDKAVYFHCWGGADRTGTVGFILDALLGVSYTEACMDYEFTSFDTVHTRLRNEVARDQAGNNYDFPGLVNAMMNSKYAKNGTASFQDIAEGWMKDKCGMNDSEINKIRENLLEPVSK